MQELNQINSGNGVNPSAMPSPRRKDEQKEEVLPRAIEIIEEKKQSSPRFEKPEASFPDGAVASRERSLSSRNIRQSVSLEVAERIGVDLGQAEKIIDAFVLSQKESYIAENEPGKLIGKDPQEELGIIKDWLGSVERMQGNLKPRLEIRLVPNIDPPVVANIALAFPDTGSRNAHFNILKESFSDLSLVSAGSTTVEIGTKDVDKSTTINYVANHFEELLIQMKYTPGKCIDASKRHTVVIADADGTLWDPPVKDRNPEATNLENSPARDGILNYLRAGGVLIVNSGNDPTRTVNRILAGIPEFEKTELLSRIAISAAGGHVLMTLDEAGVANEVGGYRENALREQKEKPVVPSEHLDVIYIGDDGRVKGNDFPAFRKVGENHFICVHNREKIVEVDPSLIAGTVPGETATVKDIFNAIVDKAILIGENPGSAGPVGLTPAFFDDIPLYVSLISSIPDAKKLEEQTLRQLGGRGGVDALIVSNDQLNGPVRYESGQIVSLLNVFNEEIRQKYTLGNPIDQKAQVKLNYDGLVQLDGVLGAALIQRGMEINKLQNNFQVESQTFEGYMQESLDKMRLKNGDTIRILEPGNNDQATPIFVAQQIKYIQDYAEKKALETGNLFKLSIQVLVMGLGGHATTATFPQIGELKGPEFSGVPEAVSLGGTLMESLSRLNISCEEKQNFDPSETNKVQIKLADKSKNTGENVVEALLADPAGSPKPPHIFVAAARTAATRQALTFAQQYSANPKDALAHKEYESIVSIPYSRSANFVRTGLTDAQAVAEMYMGLAERCRTLVYGFNPDGAFIPPSSIDSGELDELYRAYDVLSGTNNVEISKIKDIREVMAFFSKCCTTMEKSITWNKLSEFQSRATNRSIDLLMTRKSHKEAIIEAYNNFSKLSKIKNSSQDERKLLRMYRELSNSLKASREGAASITNKEKYVKYLSMIALGKKIFSALEARKLTE